MNSIRTSFSAFFVAMLVLLAGAAQADTTTSTARPFDVISTASGKGKAAALKGVIRIDGATLEGGVIHIPGSTQELTFAGGPNVVVTGNNATKTVTFNVYSSPTFHDVISKGPCVDVRAYGAVDNTDISSSFNSALASLPANGGCIIIPAGHTYQGNLSIYRSNVEITGGGTIKGSIYVLGASGAKITGTNVHGIRIVRDSISAGANGIELAWYDGAEIHNNYFSNLDNAVYVQPIDTTAYQPNGKLNFHDNFTNNANIDLKIDSFKNDWTTTTGDTHYVNNIAICNNYHIYGLSADGLVASNNTWFFPYNGTTKVNNVYLNYYDWTNITSNNIFEAGTQAISLGHGMHANVGSNSIAWPGQLTASSAIKIWGGDNGGAAYTLANIHDNKIMWPTLHGIESDASSGYISITNNYIWGPGNTTHYKGVEDVAAMTHHYISANSTADFVVTSGNVGGGTTGALFNVTGNKQFSSGDAYRLSDGTVIKTGIPGRKIITLSGSETSITSAGLFGVHLSQPAPVTVTAVSAGQENQELFFFAYNGNTTIQANSTIKTADGNNVTLRQYGSITLVYNAGSGWWHEKSRGNAFTSQPMFAYDHTDHSVTGTAVATTLYSTTIPGGTLGSNGALRVTMLGSVTNSSNNKTITLKYGTAYLLNFTVTTVATFQGQWIMRNRNSTSSQIAASGGFTNFGTTGSALNTSSIDTTADQTLAVACQLANTGETCTLNDIIVEVLK